MPSKMQVVDTDGSFLSIIKLKNHIYRSQETGLNCLSSKLCAGPGLLFSGLSLFRPKIFCINLKMYTLRTSCHPTRVEQLCRLKVSPNNSIAKDKYRKVKLCKQVNISLNLCMSIFLYPCHRKWLRCLITVYYSVHKKNIFKILSRYLIYLMLMQLAIKRYMDTLRYRAGSYPHIFISKYML